MTKCHPGCPCSGQNVVKCPLFTTNTTDAPLHAAGALLILSFILSLPVLRRMLPYDRHDLQCFFLFYD